MSEQGQSRKTTTLEALLCLVAFFGFACIVYAAGGTLGVEAGRNQVSAREHYEREKKSALRACAGAVGTAAIECATKAAESAQHQSETRQDLYAQQDSARWSWWSMLAAWVALAVTALGVWFVKRTLDATLEAVVDTGKATAAMLRQNDIVEAGQRAWLAVNAHPQLIRPIGGNDVYLRLQFEAKNLGGSIAKNVVLRCFVHFKGPGEKTSEIQEIMFDKIEKWKASLAGMPDASLIPGDTQRDAIWQTYRPPEVKIVRDPPLISRAVELIVMVAVFYRTAVAPRLVQQSWKSWYVHSIDEDGQILSLIPLESGKKHGPDQLSLEPFHIGMRHSEYPE